MIHIISLLAALALAGPVLAQSAPLNPAQTIAAATAAPGGEVEGTFEFQVGSTGASGFRVFLNSEADYRSPANLTAELQPAVSNALRTRLGGHPEELLKGKRVRIKGTAHRIAIPRRDGTSYFQTRIDVAIVSQVEILS